MARKSIAHYKILLYAGEEGYVDFSRLQMLFDVSRRTLNKYISRLAREGLVERREERVYLTDAGRKLLNTLKILKEGKQAPSYVVTDPSTGQPLPLSFANYQQLYAVLAYGLADPAVIKHHIENYMESWFRAFGDELAADLIREGRVRTAEDLKKYLEKLLLISRLLD
ncbi:MAG: winged helix-turn-helix domain-containing protein [Desulfurococcaceae archaeon]